MLAVQGTDISVVQGLNIPFDVLKSQGHEFTWIRCKVGNNPGRDMRFLDNYKRATASGLLVSPYEFFFALPHIDPLEQVKLFLDASVVDGHLVGSSRGELPPGFDLEWPPPEEWTKWKCTAQQIVNHALIALAEMAKQWGRKPKVYSYPYYLKALSGADGFNELTAYGLWIAGGNQYMNGDGHVPDLTKEQPPNVSGWGRKWQFWQHDGNGGRKLPNGIDADFNVFNGTVEDLQAMCQEMDVDVPSTSSVSLVPDPFVTNLDESMDALIHSYRQDRAQQILDTEKV